MKLSLTVMGKPISKARPRFFRRGKFVGTYNPQRTEEGRFLLEVESQLAKYTCGDLKAPEPGVPVELVCRFYFPIPKSDKKTQKDVAAGGSVFHTKRPDCDNCIKFILDCFNDYLWHDDSQVVRISVMKFYGLQPRTEVQVNTL